MPFVAGIKKLSRLVVDVSKDWSGKRIENLGTPDTDDDAARRADVAAEVTFENLDANGDVGAGANQVSPGNHTHSILHDTQDGTKEATTQSGSETIPYQTHTVSAGGTTTVCSVTLGCAGSTVVEGCVAGLSRNQSAYAHKVALYIDGTLVAEEVVGTTWTFSFLKGFKSVGPGSRTVEARISATGSYGGSNQKTNLSCFGGCNKV